MGEIITKGKKRMKKAIAMLLVIAMTAALAIGGTLAYLTDTDEDVNVMTLGQVKIDQLEYERVDVDTEDEDADVQVFHDNKPLLPAVTEDGFNYVPGDSYVNWDQIGKDGYTSDIWDPEQINNEVDKMVFVKNKGDWDAYVRTVFAFEAGSYTTLDEFNAKMHLNLNTTDWTWEWTQTPTTIGEGTYFIATATYNKVLAPGALTEISLSQIALDSSATNDDVAAFGDTYQVLVQSQAIQADGFDDPESALNEGFGEIATDNVPWISDQPIQGIDVRSALRYYRGDATQPIHSKVTDVVFGLNEDYSNIVDTYEGTLVTVEQDVDVHSYYVEEGDKYTVYFLANGEIYSPKDSSELFKQMTALTTVDTSNYDVSRVENMYSMFHSCEALTTMDVSDWDTSNVTTMEQLFYMCYMLDGLDVSDWDVSNVTNMHRTFSLCEHLTSLDVSQWDVRNVTTTAKMFHNDIRLAGLTGLGNWQTESLTACNSMFSSTSANTGNMPFTDKDLAVENWDVSEVTNMVCMFYGCGQLTKMDLSKWDVSNVVDMHHMFADCYNIVEFNFAGWDTSSVKCFSAMFNNCNSVKVLDVSSFDTQNADDIEQMFEYCYSLEEIIGLDQWETSKFFSLYEAFSCCYKLKTLDLSTWDTSAVHTTYKAFNNCDELETIYVGDGWDMSNVTKSTAAMFANCKNLVGGAGTTFVGSDLKYAHVDGGEENPGYLTHISDKPVSE